MRIVAISDTHDQHDQITIPECDILIVAGDFTCHYEPILENYEKFINWLKKQPAKYKVVVAGNHDTLFQKDPVQAKILMDEPGITYLEDSGTEIEGLKIWGSPWILPVAEWAFMARDEELKKHWDLISEDTDILITHMPPMPDARTGHVPIYCWINNAKFHCGSQSLLKRLDEIQPKIHIFGHIHEGHSSWLLDKGYFGGPDRAQDTMLYNVAICDEHNNIKFKPTIIDI